MRRIDLHGRVAIITGAGGGLGRSHALMLASRGAKVVVNDTGADLSGTGSSNAAAAVVEEIRSAGGTAIASTANITDFVQVERMVEDVLESWGRIDILVNNAGILRDRSFAKLLIEDFSAVFNVHVMGTVHCTKAVWQHMRSRSYGRIVMTTSSSGLYGNFGQSAYGAAKMAVVGLMNTLHLEGRSYNIRVNCLAPTAATRMTADIMTDEMLAMITPQSVSPGLLALVDEDAPSRMILCAGAGAFEAAHITLTRGMFIGSRDDAPEQVLAHLDEIADRTGEVLPDNGLQQSEQETLLVQKAIQQTQQER